MAMIGLVYLAWAPLGAAPLREFLGSYHAHRAGAEHELMVVLNGAEREEPGNADTGPGGEALRATLLAELEDTEHRLIELERPVLDLPAYALAARQLEHERLCFLNSYSTILADGWLGRSATRWRIRRSGLPARAAAGRPGRVDSRQARVLALPARDAPACAA